MATFDTVGSVLHPGGDDQQQRARHVAELLRVARSSLFVPRDPADEADNTEIS